MIEYRGTGQPEQLPALAAELVRRRVAVIFATETANSVFAARAATATIPIVFLNGADPVKLGLVASLNRPGGNVTGMCTYTAELVPKRAAARASTASRRDGVSHHPSNMISERNTADTQAAARRLGQEMMVWRASTVDEIDMAFAALAQRKFPLY